MQTKRVNEYEVSFKQLKNREGEPVDQQAINFVFQNHDDVSKIVETLSEAKLFKEQSETEQFVVGLKLLGDILMKNRDMELFSELQPAFVNFMKKLKGEVKR
jgi:hypothetical protein